MYRILIITTFLIPKITMSQTLTFSGAVQQLYFNVDVKNADVDTVINKFSTIANEHFVNKRMSSLSINLEMNMDGNAKKTSHVFEFSKSPLLNMVVDSGYIRIDVGEIGHSKKIIDINWCFQFLNKADAEMFFDQLKKLFTPISTKHHVGDDDLNSGQYAEYSAKDENIGGITDVTFFLSKSVATNKYEVQFIPYNEFVD